MDLKHIPFFDNHTHTLDYSDRHLDPDASVGLLDHGFREELHPEKGYPCSLEGSPELKYHIRHLGSVQTLVHKYAQYLGCEEDLDVIIQKRNEITDQIGQWEYARRLYEDENILWTTLDSELPLNDKGAAFPCTVVRLYQMDPLFDRLIREIDNYDVFLKTFLDDIAEHIRAGYIGVKCHLAERYTFQIREVSRDEAREAYKKAHMGVYKDIVTVYFAVFAEVLVLIQELDTCIHIHTGCTGDPDDGDLARLDPLLLTPFLINDKYLKAKIVLLHGSYPYPKNAAFMCHFFPNVYVDFSQAIPWAGFEFANILRDGLEMAPLSKVIIGTGQHGIPELAWLSAKIIRSALSRILGEAVASDLISEKQAEDIAYGILCGNALRLYKMDK